MAWKEAYLDIVLVPLGMILMVLYHVHLYYRIHKHPLTTVVGINHINRRAWVYSIMEDCKGNGVLAVQTIRNSIMASTLLASTAITLSSVIGALVTSNASGKKPSIIVLGGQSVTILTVKYLVLSVCYLSAFVCHVQAIRYSSHVSFLITIPMGEMAPGLTQDYVNKLINRSSNFFSLGLRAYYFSFPLLLWLFGPVPQFVCCIVMILLLNTVDTAKDFKVTLADPSKDDEVRNNSQLQKSSRSAV